MLNWLGHAGALITVIKGIWFGFTKIGKFIKYIGHLESVANALSTCLNACLSLANAIKNFGVSKFFKIFGAIISLIIAGIGVYVWLV